MRYLIHFVAVLVFTFSMSVAEAQNKVVVIPLNSAKELKNVVTVSAKGGDFTDPVAAVNSIADVSEANPYLVLIGPGVYTLTQTLVMKPYVTVAGSGQEATKLTGAISSDSLATSALVSGADNATLSDLTIENNGGGTVSIALYNDNSSPVVRNVTATAFFGGLGSYGVVNNNSSPSMTNVTATASRGTASVGVVNSNSSPIMTNVTATGNASGGTASVGVSNDNSSPIMTNVTATSSGGALSWGVSNSNSSPIMTSVTANASMGTENYGVRNYSSTGTITTIRHSTLSGTTDGIYHDGGTTRVMQSSIIHGVTDISGALTCVTSDNGFATALDISCL